MQVIQKMHPPTTPKQVHAFLGLLGYYRKFIKNIMAIPKPLTLLICHQVKFNWTLTYHEAFLHLKESITQAPILSYPNPNKRYIAYTKCIRLHLWSAVIPGTLWYRISNCLSLAHFFRNTKEMEHKETGRLWSLLCHYKMELLSPRSGYHSQEFSQTDQKKQPCLAVKACQLRT